MAVARTQALANFATTSAATIAKAITIAPGSVLVVPVLWLSATQTCTVADTLGNTYTAVVASLATNATSTWRGQCFVCSPATTGATTVTATCSGNNNERDLWIHEYSGADTSSPLDVGAAGNANGANPSINIVTVAGGAIIGATAVPVGTATVGATYTSGVSQNGNLSEDKVGTFAGSVAVPFVDASSSQWVITAVSIKAAAAGGATPTQPKRALMGVGR